MSDTSLDFRDGQWRSTELLRLGGLVDLVEQERVGVPAMWQFVMAWNSPLHGTRMWSDTVWAQGPLPALHSLERMQDRVDGQGSYIAFRFLWSPVGSFDVFRVEELSERDVELVTAATREWLTAQVRGVAGDPRFRRLER